MARFTRRLRRSALLETALLLAVMLVIDLLFLDGDRFRGVAPHPFWIVVLLMTVQYGTREALIATAACSVLLLAGNIPEQSIGQDYYGYLFEVFREPLLWMIAAVLFGELRLRQLFERDELRDGLAESERQLELLADAFQRQGEVRQRLETRLAAQIRTTTSLYQAAQGIETVIPEEVIAGAGEMVRTLLNPARYSIFLLREGSLVKVADHGWGPGDRYGERFDAGSALFREVVGLRRMLWIANRNDALTLAMEGVLAGPLFDRESGRVLGMVKIEQLEFRELNLASIYNFKILCEWIAVAYARALRYGPQPRAALALATADEVTRA